MDAEQLQKSIYPNPPIENKAVSFFFNGTCLVDIEKTGVFVEVYDTIGEHIYYQS